MVLECHGPLTILWRGPHTSPRVQIANCKNQNPEPSSSILYLKALLILPSWLPRVSRPGAFFFFCTFGHSLDFLQLFSFCFLNFSLFSFSWSFLLLLFFFFFFFVFVFVFVFSFLFFSFLFSGPQNLNFLWPQLPHDFRTKLFFFKKKKNRSVSGGTPVNTLFFFSPRYFVPPFLSHFSIHFFIFLFPSFFIFHFLFFIVSR